MFNWDHNNPNNYSYCGGCGERFEAHGSCRCQSEEAECRVCEEVFPKHELKHNVCPDCRKAEEEGVECKECEEVYHPSELAKGMCSVCQENKSTYVDFGESC